MLPDYGYSLQRELKLSRQNIKSKTSQINKGGCLNIFLFTPLKHLNLLNQ